jgi:8-oxo-dGTP pyrophosphatase MutT (NUDIX family)
MIVIDKDGKYLIANESNIIDKGRDFKGNLQLTFGLQDRTVVPPKFKSIKTTLDDFNKSFYAGTLGLTASKLRARLSSGCDETQPIDFNLLNNTLLQMSFLGSKKFNDGSGEHTNLHLVGIQSKTGENVAFQIRYPNDKVGFPKGGGNKDEEGIDIACREFREETFYALDPKTDYEGHLSSLTGKPTKNKIYWVGNIKSIVGELKTGDPGPVSTHYVFCMFVDDPLKGKINTAYATNEYNSELYNLRYETLPPLTDFNNTSNEAYNEIIKVMSKLTDKKPWEQKYLKYKAKYLALKNKYF